MYKKLIILYLIFSVRIFSQNFLNFQLADGSYKNIQLSELQIITLSASGEQLNIYHNDGTFVTQNIADLLNMTLAETGLGQALPVELSSFSALVNGTTVILKWITKTEVNNYGFEILRSALNDRHSEEGTDEEPWEKIGFVNGYGNSNSPKEYSFSDIPRGGTQFQYRLKQIDNDGKYEYSNVINVEIGSPNRFELKQNSPNPFNPSTVISYSLPIESKVSLKVYDIVGREVASLIDEEQPVGYHSIIFDGSYLSSGVYICKIAAGKYSASIKMILMK
jgi:hypothetical protein